MKKEDIDKTDPDRYLLVDIREKEELNMLPTLPGAKHIPMGEIIREAEDGKLPKDKTIVTICRSGNRCAMVNYELRAMGYDVDLLEGGLAGL